MARPKRNKEIKSINFDRLVLQALEIMCKKNGENVSDFVNNVIKRQFFHKEVDFEREFIREITKQKAAEFQFWKTHLDALGPKVNRIEIKENTIKPKIELKKRR